MSNESVTDLDERRHRSRVPAAVDEHRTRESYTYVTEALEDALLLLEDLDRHEGLLVPAEELQFTSRRVQRLLRGSVTALTRAGEQR